MMEQGLMRFCKLCDRKYVYHHYYYTTTLLLNVATLLHDIMLDLRHHTANCRDSVSQNYVTTGLDAMLLYETLKYTMCCITVHY